MQALLQIATYDYGAFTPKFDVHAYSKAIDVNVKGPALFVRATTAAMAQQEPLTYDAIGRDGGRSLERGSIVLLASVAAFVASPGMAAYTTCKHATPGILRSAGKASYSSRDPLHSSMG